MSIFQEGSGLCLDVNRNPMWCQNYTNFFQLQKENVFAKSVNVPQSILREFLDF